jgi:hypothetical protein
MRRQREFQRKVKDHRKNSIKAETNPAETKKNNEAINPAIETKKAKLDKERNTKE